MIAFWLGLPLALRLLSLTVVGAVAGGLLNAVLYAYSNVVRLSNPWAPPLPPPATASEQRRPAADDRHRRPGTERIPIAGWLRIRNQDDQPRWLPPLLLELCCALLVPFYYWCEIRVGGMIPAAIAIWITVELPVRYGLLASLGLVAGALANYLVYAQAYDARPISPWTPAADEAPPRRWTDRLPLLGWIGLRREGALHGAGFWVRPMLIELALMVALPVLYAYHTQQGGPLPEIARNDPAFLARFEPAATQIYLAHAVLLVLMVAATFIDFDERTIPDAITIPGTILALMFSIVVMKTNAGAFAVGGWLPTAIPVCEAPQRILPTTFDAPWFAAPLGATKWAGSTGLLTALAIWSGWCAALTDRRFSRRMLRRYGFDFTIRFFLAALVRPWALRVLVALWIAGTIFVAVIWAIGGNYWYGLFSSLVGLAVGGGTIWSIRIVASWAMDMEAMGFGDVTLMAMVGAVIGWQGAILAFFLAPFAAIAIVLIQFVITRDHHVPFGPYLCAGTLLTIVGWDAIYNQWLACNLLLLWPILIWLAVSCLGLMGVMLFASRMLRTLLGHRYR